MNKSADTPEIVGLRLKSRPPHQPMEVREEVISAACLAEMSRRSLRPILSIQELNQRGREFTTVSGFATIFEKQEM